MTDPQQAVAAIRAVLTPDLLKPQYARGVGKGFLTREPSRRAAEILRRLGAEAAAPPGRRG